MASQKIKGVLSPVLTPFNPDYTPSTPRFLKHCRSLVEMAEDQTRQLMSELAAAGYQLHNAKALAHANA